MLNLEKWRRFNNLLSSLAWKLSTYKGQLHVSESVQVSPASLTESCIQ